MQTTLLAISAGALLRNSRKPVVRGVARAVAPNRTIPREC